MYTYAVLECFTPRCSPMTHDNESHDVREVVYVEDTGEEITYPIIMANTLRRY